MYVAYLKVGSSVGGIARRAELQGERIFLCEKKKNKTYCKEIFYLY